MLARLILIVAPVLCSVNAHAAAEFVLRNRRRSGFAEVDGFGDPGV
jgi:hypothetical protein